MLIHNDLIIVLTRHDKVKFKTWQFILLRIMSVNLYLHANYFLVLGLKYYVSIFNFTFYLPMNSNKQILKQYCYIDNI